MLKLNIDVFLCDVISLFALVCIVAAHKETSALLRSTQNIVRRKHHVPVHGVPSTAIIVPNYVRYVYTSLQFIVPSILILYKL